MDDSFEIYDDILIFFQKNDDNFFRVSTNNNIS